MRTSATTKEFAERLSDLINEYPGTMAQLAKASGVPAGSLSNYQNDAAEVGINNLVKIAKFFDVSTDYLLGLATCEIAENEAIYSRIGLSDRSIDMLEINTDMARELRDVNIGEIMSDPQVSWSTAKARTARQVMNFLLEHEDFTQFLIEISLALARINDAYCNLPKEEACYIDDIANMDIFCMAGRAHMYDAIQLATNAIIQFIETADKEAREIYDVDAALKRNLNMRIVNNGEHHQEDE